ncbi:hypothetical protein EW026_g3434 [Hermanssonia centrifuga]|uniref:Uncharacterized protein n=2 Tax=Hermanssonia centrifuga TaxID=98765 RepID=A0A4S4KKQ0_9APHY|nr:hypothetical protein EW026_g3434 [Hermanssonia centrifuga]
MLAVPYLAFGLFVAIGSHIALEHTERVNREQRYFYCSLNWNPFTYAVEILSTLICLVSITFGIHIAITTSRHWRLLRRGGHLTDENMSLTIRVFVFTLYLLTSTVMNLASIWATPGLGIAPDMLSASVGMALFLIFVSQRDIFRAWCFWSKYKYDNTRSSTLSRPIYRRPSQFVAPALSSNETLRADRSSKGKSQDSMRDYYEAKTQGKGVQIIGRPDEAFRRPEEVVKNIKSKKDKRSTISTWGF